MASIGFWNVDSLHRPAGLRQIPRIARQFADEWDLDALFLIECELSEREFTAAFEGTDYVPFDSADRFTVYTRLNPEELTRLSPPVLSNRFDVWQLSLPLNKPIICGVVHGPDRRNNNHSGQTLFFQQVVETISYFERELDSDRSMIFGDFNANPFDPAVAGVAGLHAVMSRNIASKEQRVLFEKNYKYFYNPMWNLYGDEPVVAAPATYHFTSSDPEELYWHMLDQVVIRPSLINEFDSGKVTVVTEIGGTSLLRSSGVPNRTKYSDHLPVTFEIGPKLSD